MLRSPAANIVAAVKLPVRQMIAVEAKADRVKEKVAGWSKVSSTVEQR